MVGVQKSLTCQDAVNNQRCLDRIDERIHSKHSCDIAMKICAFSIRVSSYVRVLKLHCTNYHPPTVYAYYIKAIHGKTQRI
jgi:hypothetical protein